MSNVTVMDSGCWKWTASKFRNGYGQCNGRLGSVLAHRASYFHFVGDIPSPLELDHLCRNVWCVNPTHLEAVPHRINSLRGKGGWRHSAEWVARVAARNRGKVKPRTTEWQAKIAASNRGKKRTDEQKARLSAALIGKKRPRTVEWQNKLSLSISRALSGRPKTTQHKVQMSIGRRNNRVVSLLCKNGHLRTRENSYFKLKTAGDGSLWLWKHVCRRCAADSQARCIARRREKVA